MSRQAGSSTPFVLGFLALAVITLGGEWRLDMARRDGRQTATSINDQLRLAEQSLAEFRGAQTAYFAAGLKTDDWTEKASASSVQLERAVNTLSGLTTTAPDARQHYAQSATLVAVLNANDKKAREFIASGQPLVATDVIFQEGAEPAKNLTTELAAARDAEMAAFEKLATKLGVIGLGANGAALAIGLLLIAIGSGTPKTQEAEALVEGLNLHVNAEPTESKPVAPEPVVDPFLAPSVDLSGAAELCVDLGRVLDGRDLPALMGRAADVLDAKGLVLWVSENDGTVLRPSVAHGYSDRVLQRMGTLTADGDNVTSLAFRSRQPQVLRSTFDGHGAIAVPLLTAGGCVGVLAAEVQGAKPGDTRFAVARMIAAQLSTLVGPGSSPASKSAGAAN